MLQAEDRAGIGIGLDNCLNKLITITMIIIIIIIIKNKKINYNNNDNDDVTGWLSW